MNNREGAIHAYAVQLLDSLEDSKLVNLKDLANECKSGSVESCIEVLCKLKEKGVRIADEALAKNCNWSIRKVKLKDFVLPDGGNVAEACKGALGVAGDTKIVAVKEGYKYRVIAGVDAIKALVCERRASLDAEVEAYVVECEGEPEADDTCYASPGLSQLVLAERSWVRIGMEEPEMPLDLSQNRYVNIVIESNDLDFLQLLMERLSLALGPEVLRGIKIVPPTADPDIAYLISQIENIIDNKRTRRRTDVTDTRQNETIYLLIIQIDIEKRYINNTTYSRSKMSNIEGDLYAILKEIVSIVQYYVERQRVAIDVDLKEWLYMKKEVISRYASEISKLIRKYNNRYGNLLSV